MSLVLWSLFVFIYFKQTQIGHQLCNTVKTTSTSLIVHKILQIWLSHKITPSDLLLDTILLRNILFIVALASTCVLLTTGRFVLELISSNTTLIL